MVTPTVTSLLLLSLSFFRARSFFLFLAGAVVSCVHLSYMYVQYGRTRPRVHSVLHTSDVDTCFLRGLASWAPYT